MAVRGEKGYTLIELLAVVAILSIMTAMIMPKTSAFTEINIDSFANEMAVEMRLLQQQAIAESIYWEMRFRDDYVAIYRDSEYQRTIYLPQGVKWGNTKTANNPKGHKLRFYPNGAPGFVPLDGFDSMSTYAINDSKHTRYIIVAPVLGRVRVSKKPPKK